MGKNMERLGRVLDNRNKRTIADNTTLLYDKIELATIDSNLALVPDSLRTPIPKGSYMLPLFMTAQLATKPATCTTTHQHDLPDQYRTIQSGDRVIMAWCGNEPVILSIVVSS